MNFHGNLPHIVEDTHKHKHTHTGIPTREMNVDGKLIRGVNDEP